MSVPRSRARFIAVFVFALGTAACVPSAEESFAASTQRILDSLTRECSSGNASSCLLLGDKYLQLDPDAASSRWSFHRDRRLARLAYLRGCKLGAGRACQRLLEYGLLDDEAQRVATEERMWAAGENYRSTREQDEERRRFKEGRADAERLANSERDEARRARERERQDLRDLTTEVARRLESSSPPSGVTSGTAGAPGTAPANCPCKPTKCTEAHCECYRNMRSNCQCYLDNGGCGVDPKWLRQCIDENTQSLKDLSCK